MKLPLSYKIAKRYLLGKKSTNAINLISIITIVAMAFGTFTMITLMSVFNGFEELVVGMYNVFYSDLKVEPQKGKYFDLTENDIEHLKKIDGIVTLSALIEEDALLEYQEGQYVATVLGVDSNYFNVVGLNEDFISHGSLLLEDDLKQYSIIGAGVRNGLRVNVEIPSQIKVSIPRKNAKMTSIENAFNFKYITPAGEFSVQQDFDEKYILVPQSFIRDIRGGKNDYSSLQIKLANNDKEQDVVKSIKKILPNAVVKNRWQQNSTLYTVMQTEKWVVFAILTFILLIVSFSITGALSMLIVEKKKDIAVLRSLGASSKMIRNIFLMEGLLLSLVGVILGVILAVSCCLIQQYIGIIRLPGESFVVDFYPVKMKFIDFAATLSVIILISLLASYFPTLKAERGENISENMRME